MSDNARYEMPTIAAIILTKDEEIHIGRCIKALRGVCKEVFVVDSYSSDGTVEIARDLGATVEQHVFENQAQQFNWAIDNLKIASQWIWRVDADEYMPPEDAAKLMTAITNCDDDVNGIYVNRAIVFHGRKLRYGGWYPSQQIKIIRKGFGRSEKKVMDEHLTILSGRTMSVDADQIDENLRGLAWWTDKHNAYSSREAINMLLMQYGLDDESEGVKARLLGSDSERRRWFKTRYAHMPLLIRPFLYFIARYFFMLGFLDGRWGLVWHVLQGLWYRFLTDAKIIELKQSLGFSRERLMDYLENIKNQQK